MAEEQKRPDVVQERLEWRENQPTLDAGSLVFIDESSASTNMTRRHGRAPVGQRVHDHAPHGHYHSTTMIAAMGMKGPMAPMLLDGATDSEAFMAWIAQFLAPCLRQGDIVVMDNLSAHKAPGVERLIEERGARLLYLPPYSPDFNPIEMMWSKIKTLLRGAKARTQEALQQAVASALSAVTTDDIKGWIKHCGYTIV